MARKKNLFKEHFLYGRNSNNLPRLSRYFRTGTGYRRKNRFLKLSMNQRWIKSAMLFKSWNPLRSRVLPPPSRESIPRENWFSQGIDSVESMPGGSEKFKNAGSVVHREDVLVWKINQMKTIWEAYLGWWAYWVRVQGRWPRSGSPHISLKNYKNFINYMKYIRIVMLPIGFAAEMKRSQRCVCGAWFEKFKVFHSHALIKISWNSAFF